MSTEVPILLYHSVSADAPEKFAPWSVDPKLFAEHMEALAASDWTVLNARQLAEARSSGEALPANTVVLTFDDGLLDFAQHAWPVLQQHRLPATHYVAAGCVGGTSTWLEEAGAGHLPMLSAEQLRELAGEGLDIGAHSMSHPQLDAIDRARAREEIHASKQVLEDILGAEVTGFAYPHGYHDAAVKQMVKDAGYQHAAAVRNALSHGEDDLFALARYTVMNDCTTAQLLGILDGVGIERAPKHEQLQTKVWRAVRRVRTRVDGLRK